MCQSVLFQDYSTFVQTFPQNLEQRYTTVARSPDLAPIEHVCDILEHIVRCRHDVRTRPQMIIALRRKWAAISQNDIRAIVGSMRR